MRVWVRHDVGAHGPDDNAVWLMFDDGTWVTLDFAGGYEMLPVDSILLRILEKSDSFEEVL